LVSFHYFKSALIKKMVVFSGERAMKEREKSSKWYLVAGLLTLCFGLLTTEPALSDYKYLSDSAPTQAFWDNPVIWDPTGVPGEDDLVILKNFTGTNRTVAYLYPSAEINNEIINLEIIAIGSGSMTLWYVDGPSLHILSQVKIGEYMGSKPPTESFSIFRQDSGGVQVGQYVIVGYTDIPQFWGGSIILAADDVLNNGIYNLKGGSLEAKELIVGDQGKGAFQQEGGYNNIRIGIYDTPSLYHTEGQIILGRSPTGNGIYELKEGTARTIDVIVGGQGVGSFWQTGGTVNAANLYIGGGGGSKGTYELGGTGELTCPKQYIGYFGIGVFTQAGGLNNVAWPIGQGYESQDESFLELGTNPFTKGTYNLSSGQLTAPKEIVGRFGIGTFNHSGGTNTVGDLIMGEGITYPGVGGIYKLSGTGTLEVKSNAVIGDTGIGVFEQQGGSHTIQKNLYLGLYGSWVGPNSFVRSQGTYTLSGSGILKVYGSEYVGCAGIGKFIQSGGTNVLSGSLNLGIGVVIDSPAGQGTYELNAGNLIANNGEYIGFGGKGTFTQKGGINDAMSSLLIGPLGTYNLQGGTLFANTSLIYQGGTFNKTGSVFTTGNLTNAGTIYLGGSGLTKVTGKTENLTGGLIHVDGNPASFGDDVINYGTFKVTNAAVDFGGTYRDYGAWISEGAIVAAKSLIIGGDYRFSGGSLSADTLLVTHGGTFMGDGTLSAAFTNNGLVKPGSSPGTLNIVGSYTQGPGGVLEVEIASPTSYDRLNVSGVPGTANLTGKLNTVLLGSPGNSSIPIITATGGVNGAFSNPINQQLTPTLFQEIRYNPFSVDLQYTRDYTNPGLGLCPNQRQVGNLLNSVAFTTTGDLNYVLSTVDLLPTAGAVRDAFQDISADKASALTQLGLAGAVLQQRSLAQRITDLRFGSQDLGLGGGFTNPFSLSGSSTSGLLLAYNAVSLAGKNAAKKGAESSPPSWGVFLDPAVIIGSQGYSGKQTGFDYNLAGFTLGVDYRVRPDLLVGLATGYSNTTASFKGSGGSMTNNTWPLTAYAAYLPNWGYAFLSLGYSLNLLDLEREISFGGLTRRANSSTTGHQFNLYAEGGYDFRVKNLVVTPAVSLAYANISVGGFTENNAGALNLRVNSQQADSLQTGVGAKVAAAFKAGQVKVVPQTYAFYQHEFSNNSRGLDARLAQGSATMTFTTANPARDFAVVGGDITAFFSKKASAYVNYNAEVGRTNSSAHFISGGFRWEF